MNKLMSYGYRFYHSHRNLILYGIIGGMGAAIDLLIYIVLTQKTSLSPAFASFISVSMGITNNFLLNSIINFKKKDNAIYRFASFYAVGAVGALLSSVTIWALIEVFTFGPLLAKVLTIPPVVLAQYFLNRKVSFGETASSSHFRITVDIVYVAIPIVLFFYFTGYIFSSSALGYDDSYNLQISQNIAQHGSYATNGSLYSGERKLFDPYITTGPTLLLPVALCLKVFGNTVFATKIVPFIVFLGFVCTIGMTLWSLLQSRVRNWKLSWATVIVCIGLVLFASSTENLLTSVVGELLALTLFILALNTYLKKRFVFAGALFGLAILTKSIFIIGFVMVIFESACRLYKDRHILKFVQLLASAFSPLLLFELYKFTAYGYSLSAYKANLSESITFFKGAGSGFDSAANTVVDILHTRLSFFIHANPLTSGAVPAIIFGIVTATAFCIVIWYFFRTIWGALAQKVGSNYQLFAYTSISVIWLAWWFIVADRLLIRHAYPAIVLLIISASAILAIKLANIRYSGQALLVFYLLGILLIALLPTSYGFQFGKSTTQIEDAAKISRFYQHTRLYHLGWWQNPEIQYLLDKTSYPYTHALSDDKVGYVLFGPVEKMLAPDIYSLYSKQCNSMQQLGNNYMVCEVKR